ncbi:Adaptor protein complex beta subunit [Nadsonia fulvescens var. elongata DSM 6958]|uniref:AP complex subunit beta n=1 Tax=Nadsonia fulvescens var. elongata DSM 6958 TaxID=857566 RepID=A0A1E3PR67_9ASCO|nr:Adaptor protein complex beta subunit [Nadsonia fulvescens var. elongata DSM 6958]
MSMSQQIERRIRKAFQTPKKGETFELRNGLVSQYARERKDAIQRTIQAMTVGKDVSALFPDILKNIATPDIEQKKLVYLYLMNYAKSHPELCILAVNTFVQDASDPNPLVRALAIRTMGCIRVDKMVDYMEIPLRLTLKDENPYVRKTAAICVTKLFDLNPQLCIEEGFLESLQTLIEDSNPMVVANAVSALAEIQDRAPEIKCFVVDPHILSKLLVALNECTEWGRIAILTSLSDYKASDIKDAEHICERVVPQLQHANPSVVLAAIKAVIAHVEIQNSEAKANLLRKLGPPLVTLVSSAPEVQYVALRNIRIILQKYPQILNRELRVFFCKYNDPPYLKMEKLEIMVRIANEKNIDQLLSELKEYSMEVDLDFVRRAIRAIGQCAIKIESAVEKCVNVLMDLIYNKVNYVLQEVVIVMKDVLRKYKTFESCLPVLCQNIDELDESEARAALVWIVGEYADKIDNSGEILQGFVSIFNEEATQVQLQLITAVVKLYIKKPEAGQNMIQGVLQTGTKSDNADVRDRGYIYWRLLSSDTVIAKDIVLAEKPPIVSTIEDLPKSLLNELIGELSTLASVYHRPAATFMGHGKFGADAVQKRAIEEQKQLANEDEVGAGVNAENLLDVDFSVDSPTVDSPASNPVTASKGGSALDELNDLFAPVQIPKITGNASSNQDIMNMFKNTAPTSSVSHNLSSTKDAFAELNFDNSFSSHANSGVPSKSSKTNEDLLGLF